MHLRTAAKVGAIFYAGAVPLLYGAMLMKNGKHVRDGGSTRNARAIRLLTSGYERDTFWRRNWEVRCLRLID